MPDEANHLDKVAKPGNMSRFPGTEYTSEELLFMQRMHQYKQVNGRPFPHWSEVLAVLKSLGYRKVEKEEPLPRLRKPG